MNEQAVVGQFQAVRTDPDNPLEWVRLAEILERTARECRQQARSLSEGLASVELLAIAVDLEPFRRAIQRQPGNAENWARLSKALYEAGDRRGSQVCQRRANKLLESSRPGKGNEAQENTDPKPRLKTCPYCGKPIPVRLNRCDHCGGSWIHQSVVAQPLPTLEKTEPSKRPDATDHSSNQGFFYTVLAVVSAAIIYVFTVLVPAIIQAISKALGEFGKLLLTTWKAIQPLLLSSLRSMWRITMSIGKALWKFSGLFGLWLWKVIRWVVVAFFSVIKRILIGSGLMPIPLRLFYLLIFARG